MKNALVCLALLVASCGGPKTTCTPEARAALLELYSLAASEVISSGACDRAPGGRVDQCPAYLAVETQMAVAQKGMCE